MTPMNKRGSILIASLWAVSIFSIFAARLGFQGTQHAILMKRELGSFGAKADFLSGLGFATEAVLKDPEPHEDSLNDSWQGIVGLPEPWKGRLELEMEDEESKVNLNSASQAFLESFLKLFEEEVDSLKGEKRKLVRELLKQRAKGRIRSFEELYLWEDTEKEDLDKLRPYLTVDSESSQLNLNTVGPLVLKAFIESLPGDDFAKDELFKKIMKYREEKEDTTLRFFRSEELQPNIFLSKLGLSPSLQLIALVNQFLPQVTTDSRTWRVRIQTQAGGGREAEAVIREKAEGFRIEVLRWYEE